MCSLCSSHVFACGHPSAIAEFILCRTSASLGMTSQRATPETFGNKIKELQNINTSLPGEEGRKLLLYTSLGQLDKSTEEFKEAVTSTALVCAEALKDVFVENAS